MSTNNKRSLQPIKRIITTTHADGSTTTVIKTFQPKGRTSDEAFPNSRAAPLEENQAHRYVSPRTRMKAASIADGSSIVTDSNQRNTTDQRMFLSSERHQNEAAEEERLGGAASPALRVPKEIKHRKVKRIFVPDEEAHSPDVSKVNEGEILPRNGTAIPEAKTMGAKEEMNVTHSLERILEEEELLPGIAPFDDDKVIPPSDVAVLETTQDQKEKSAHVNQSWTRPPATSPIPDENTNSTDVSLVSKDGILSRDGADFREEETIKVDEEVNVDHSLKRVLEDPPGISLFDDGETLPRYGIPDEEERSSHVSQVNKVETLPRNGTDFPDVETMKVEEEVNVNHSVKRELEDPPGMSPSHDGETLPRYGITVPETTQDQKQHNASVGIPDVEPMEGQEVQTAHVAQHFAMQTPTTPTIPDAEANWLYVSGYDNVASLPRRGLTVQGEQSMEDQEIQTAHAAQIPTRIPASHKTVSASPENHRDGLTEDGDLYKLTVTPKAKEMWLEAGGPDPEELSLEQGQSLMGGLLVMALSSDALSFANAIALVVGWPHRVIEENWDPSAISQLLGAEGCYISGLDLSVTFEELIDVESKETQRQVFWDSLEAGFEAASFAMGSSSAVVRVGPHQVPNYHRHTVITIRSFDRALQLRLEIANPIGGDGHPFTDYHLSPIRGVVIACRRFSQLVDVSNSEERKQLQKRCHVQLSSVGATSLSSDLESDSVYFQPGANRLNLRYDSDRTMTVEGSRKTKKASVRYEYVALKTGELLKMRRRRGNLLSKYDAKYSIRALNHFHRIKVKYENGFELLEPTVDHVWMNPQTLGDLLEDLAKSSESHTIYSFDGAPRGVHDFVNKFCEHLYLAELDLSSGIRAVQMYSARAGLPAEEVFPLICSCDYVCPPINPLDRSRDGIILVL